MNAMSYPDSRGLDVAIIGGGASGTLTAVQLLREAASRRLALRIKLIDQHGRHALGQAYSTDNQAHLLNAMVGQMSALSDDPDHLLRWAIADSAVPAGEDGQRAACRIPPTRTTFLSRLDYGRYLRDTLADAEHHALPVATLTPVTAEVVAIRSGPGRPVRLILRDGYIEADVAVLATGNAPAGLPFAAPPSGRVITDPWRPAALAGIAAQPADPAGSADTNGQACIDSVVIVGTGLTMLDLAVTISASNPAAVIHAVSRHGMLPRPHPGTPPSDRDPMWLPFMTRTTGPVRLTDLMWQVRSAVGASPGSWFDVMDRLRPLVPGLWRRLPMKDKRLFLRHVARYWEAHRHLVPPQTASRITALRATGRLQIHRGRVQAVTKQGDDRLAIQLEAGAVTRVLEADWLVNGTGSTTDIEATASPLLRDLFATGLARPDPLRLGIDAAPDGGVLSRSGEPSTVLFALGPPLRGLWYETTAMPEIRAQAAALARRITSDALAKCQHHAL
jgi:uncharacterized NAD(P)/FAD-binding protein YdhS